ncbi:hypothetical protein JTE90_019891 [Oedothorax gibbosus]|uniref:Uncharacterized protein n=1 Tax=Oedothorax gibbosus TaxID=931172 RepID=A0AAV6VYI1_9ARAC|nr:hypothetical protein JTE90_019891 [Oedothorax gibbosus]
MSQHRLFSDPVHHGVQFMPTDLLRHARISNPPGTLKVSGTFSPLLNSIGSNKRHAKSAKRKRSTQSEKDIMLHHKTSSKSYDIYVIMS